jgi:hypothetical protein
VTSICLGSSDWLNEAAGAAVTGSLADSGEGAGKNIGGKSGAQPPGWTPYEYTIQGLPSGSCWGQTKCAARELADLVDDPFSCGF